MQAVFVKAWADLRGRLWQSALIALSVGAAAALLYVGLATLFAASAPYDKQMTRANSAHAWFYVKDDAAGRTVADRIAARTEVADSLQRQVGESYLVAPDAEKVPWVQVMPLRVAGLIADPKACTFPRCDQQSLYVLPETFARMVVLGQYREIAVLKSLGFTGAQVLLLYIGQTACLSLAGGAGGVLAGHLLTVHSMAPLARTMGTPDVLHFMPAVGGLVFAVVLPVAALFAALAAWRAVALRPAAMMGVALLTAREQMREVGIRKAIGMSPAQVLGAVAAGVRLRHPPGRRSGIARRCVGCAAGHRPGAAR